MEPDDFDFPMYYDSKAGTFKFLHDIDDDDSGVDEIPFSAYDFDVDDIHREVCGHSSQHSTQSSQGFVKCKPSKRTTGKEEKADAYLKTQLVCF